MLKETLSNWSTHKCSAFGAALAYYSIFSFGPLMLIATVIAGVVFGTDAARGAISGQVHGLLGDSGAQAVQALLNGADHPYQGVLATIFGIGTLLFAAVSVVVQLKTALNTVWECDTAQQGGWWELIRSYLVSLAGVVSLGFLLLVSLLFTAAISASAKYFGSYLPGPIFQIVGSVVSFLFITVLFAMMFKWLPDTHVHWRDVWLGAVLTAALFEGGKFLIGYYIGKLALQSTYGAAASLVMLLIWVYYSAQIVLLGAEFTHVYARRHGRHTKPEPATIEQSDAPVAFTRPVRRASVG
ncbi:MAG TPA: YihY/virulence factor BrkB family protein [Xanthobacteraceae bacterium]|nr:YihY/virulence factor BrkB family protein [Xanthobacteraceae bacterium]